MTEASTETRNGWGPAAPAVGDSSEEPETGHSEEQAVEEIGGEEEVAANGSGRRVYNPEEDYADAGDPPPSDSKDEDDPEDEELEEFGHDPGVPPQAPAAAVDEAEGNYPEVEEYEEDEDEQEEEYEEEQEQEFATSQAPQAPAQSQPRNEFEQEPVQGRQATQTDDPAPTGAASNGTKTSAKQTQARSRQNERGADQRQTGRQQPSEKRRRAFDPDAASRDGVREDAYKGVDEQVPDRREFSSEFSGEFSSESSNYGSYGAGSLRRSVVGSLKKLPIAGKLFGSGTSSAAERQLSQPPADDQGIATKPSPQEVERRLALALRETSIDGFSKIAVGSPKGGVGKSSLAYAIGCAIANHTNIRVCLVDADPEFGATRSLVPRPVPYSVVELARDADDLHRLSDLRSYVAQNERMRLDVLLNPSEMIHKAQIGDLPAAYERIDEALSRFYDLVIYDMGIGFSHPQIQTVLGLSDELLLVGDSEVVPNDIFGDALSYIQGLGFSLEDATLAISHRLPPTDESATTGLIKSEHAKKLRRVTEVPYDASFSQLLNRRAFRVDALSLQTRLGILTTAAASLEGLRTNAAAPNKKG